jgi:hypothetical protein
MKLSLFLMALAACLSTLAFYLEGAGPAGDIVVAARHAQPRTVSGTPGNAEVPPAPAHANPPPLFRSAQSAQLAQAPRSGESFALVGLAGVSDARVAFLRDQVDGRNWSVRIGDRAGEWIVAAIDDRCVLLTRAARRQSVCL